MKIAAFNVENLFNRPRIFDNKNAAVASDVLAAAGKLTKLFEKQTYSSADKTQMLDLMEQLGILKTDESEFIWLRRIRGKLIFRPKKKGKPEIIASGRGDWIGWIEHKTMPVGEIAIHNTGRVIRDVAADILAVVEAENRITLKQFSEAVLSHVNKENSKKVTYDEVMLIDGNDDRGIDVGVMTRKGHRIESVVSHVHEMLGEERLFSRDCPEYAVRTPSGKRLYVLPNHLKSKFGGDSPKVPARREAQAKRVAAIYKGLRARGEDLVVVLGDLNDTPDSDPLKPLLKQTDLKDVSAHPSFDTGEYEGIGTFGPGTGSNKIDYLLLSPALFEKVRASGLFRKGCYPGKKPKWSVYDSLKEEHHAASDHHLIWVDIDI
jgi:endonuclease/exonuclease/phosphatase family metal-dependent hydrolase